MRVKFEQEKKVLSLADVPYSGVTFTVQNSDDSGHTSLYMTVCFVERSPVVVRFPADERVVIDLASGEMFSLPVDTMVTIRTTTATVEA